MLQIQQAGNGMQATGKGRMPGRILNALAVNIDCGGPLAPAGDVLGSGSGWHQQISLCGGGAVGAEG